jgi:uncharacterized protein (TIGR03437 family)
MIPGVADLRSTSRRNPISGFPGIRIHHFPERLFTCPGIRNYSINGPGSGVLVNGTLIASEPAAPGSEVALYGTGAGVVVPAGVDGTVTPSTPLYPLANASSVTATIGGEPATVVFIGAAPDEVTGVFQVNLKVPSGLSGDALPVAITIQGVTTLTGPTIAVQ